MSKFITEDDAAVGYSSEQDDFDSEMLQDVIISAEPNEIYVGNTGEVDASQFFNEFKFFGYVTDMHLWRTYNHLYHARIVYKSPASAAKAISERNGTFYNGKRLRVSIAKAHARLDYPAAIRIDDICAECSEEDIYDHFSVCGPIRFVVKTGFAAYIQFDSSLTATKALDLEMVLNGDPYTVSRIFSDDRKNHDQIIENMKEIKYRKPFVMVENFPRYENNTPLGHYKTNFQVFGAVRHFKIAPTKDSTVTLALCIDKLEERELVIDRFNETMLGDKQLKLYMAPAKARMTIDHAIEFASCKNTILVDGIPPYYKDYDVCKMFRRCGDVNLVERFNAKWMISFNEHAAVSLAQFYHFIIDMKRLVVKMWSPETLPIRVKTPLLDYVHPKTKGKQKFFYKMGKEVEMSKALEAAAASVKLELAATSSAKNTDESTSDPTTIPSDCQPEAKSHTEIIDLETGGENEPKNAVRMVNLPKGINERDLRELFQGKPIQAMILQCTVDSYHPSAEALLSFKEKEHLKDVLVNHHQTYRGNRVMIMRYGDKASFFMPETSLILKNLGSNVTSEGLLEEVEKMLGLNTVEDVLKPAHHYAYIEFKGDITAKDVINRLRDALTRHKIDVYPLYLSVPKYSTPSRPHKTVKVLDDVRKKWKLKLPSEIKCTDRHFGVSNGHKLFVGNIPRDTAAEDIIDYFNNFGDVIDYKPIEKKSCYLRKSVILSFINFKHAENAYLQRKHFFEGALLDVHLMDCPPYQFLPETTVLTIKFHSPFLTIDEIRYGLRKLIDFNYALKFDAYDDRANYIVRYRHKLRNKVNLFTELAKIEYINDEAVLFVDGLDLTPPTSEEAREKKDIILSPHRKHKESYLSFLIYKENLKEDLEIRTKSISEDNVPLRMFFNNNSIQINNVAVKTQLEDIRDLFRKCGNIVDYRALILEEDQTKICFVKFEHDLAADLACTYNQRMLNGKRIMIHLVKEAVQIERGRSIFVERLNPSTTAEEIHDGFSSIGMIKYVQKQSPFTAIVCFKQKESTKEALSVSHLQKLKGITVDICEEDYDSRFFNNFSVQEEYISIERLRSTLKPCLRPEYHQSEIDGLSFESLPGVVKSEMINEIFMVRSAIRDFNKLNKTEQICIIKSRYKDFPHKEYFVRLNVQEQEKLLEITETLEREYLEATVSPAKRPRDARNNESVDTFAANWYSSPASQPNATYIAATLPSSGLLLGSMPPLAGCPPPSGAPMPVPPPKVSDSSLQLRQNPYGLAPERYASTSRTSGPSPGVDRYVPLAGTGMSSVRPGQMPMTFQNNPVRPPPRPSDFISGSGSGPPASGSFSAHWARRTNSNKRQPFF